MCVKRTMKLSDSCLLVVVVGALICGVGSSAGHGYAWSEKNCSSMLHIPIDASPSGGHFNSETIDGVTSSERCPPWFFYDGTNNTCHFAYFVDGRASYVRSTLQTVVLECHCMTNDSHTGNLAITACPFTCLVSAGYYSLPCDTKNVEDFTCGRFNRNGLSCGGCAPGTAPPIHSYSSHCVPCDRKDYVINGIKYLIIAFVPLTLFTLCVIVCQVKATSPYLFSYVFFVQTITMTVNLRLVWLLLEMGKIKSEGITKFGVMLLSICNLDFFRMYYTPFCLHPNVNTMVVNFLDILVALYPFLVIGFIAVLVKLGIGRGRICKLVFSPVKGWCNRHNIEWDMTRNLTGAFATFILLSSGKIISVAFDMLMPAYVYPMNQSEPKRLNLLTSGNVEYFGSEHAPFAVLSLFVVIALQVVPAVLLILYPISLFRRLLRKMKMDSEILHLFVGFFHESYRSKHEDGSEFRWFPVTYFILRIVLMMLYGATLSSFFFPIEGVILTAFVVFLAVCRPRKSEVHNAIDIFHVMCYLIFILGIMANITANSQTKRKEFLRTSIIIISFSVFLLLLYLVSLGGYVVWYRMGLGRQFKSFLLRTPAKKWLIQREGYVRINDDKLDENNDNLASMLVDRVNDGVNSETEILTQQKVNSYSSTYQLTGSSIIN